MLCRYDGVAHFVFEAMPIFINFVTSCYENKRMMQRH